MKVKCIDHDICEPYGDLRFGKEYIVIEELNDMYCVIDEVKDRNYVSKESFKAIK